MNFIKRNWNLFANNKGYSKLYWSSISFGASLKKEYLKLFSLHLNKNAKVLDLGAGRLFYKKIILKYTKNYKSLDFQKTHKDLDYIGTTSKTGLDKESFDLVFCSQVLEHVSNPEDSFKEIYRILKKGGIAIISTPFLMYLHNEPYDYFRYTRHALLKFSNDSDFEVVRLREIGGLFGFIGSIVAMLLIGLFWRIPILNWVAYGINFVLQKIFYFLDWLTKNSKVFPSNYLLVVRKK